MTDKRLTPANERVAAEHLRGIVSAPKYIDGTPYMCRVPVADMLSEPHGRRGSQLLHGETFTVYDLHEGFAYGQAGRDGYCGYIRYEELGAVQSPTHRVRNLATQNYPLPDFKTIQFKTFSLGAILRVISEDGKWALLADGTYVPRAHLADLETDEQDPVAVAKMFLGTPYLWGGKSRDGIDCSGLVQIALQAAGRDCPRDSDMQEEQLGETVPLENCKYGDLIFWKGHVGFIVEDNTLLHANVHHMCVAYENLSDAIKRIAAAGDGPVTSVKRL